MGNWKVATQNAELNNLKFRSLYFEFRNQNKHVEAFFHNNLIHISVKNTLHRPEHWRPVCLKPYLCHQSHLFHEDSKHQNLKPKNLARIPYHFSRRCTQRRPSLELKWGYFWCPDLNLRFEEPMMWSFCYQHNEVQKWPRRTDHLLKTWYDVANVLLKLKWK